MTSELLSYALGGSRNESKISLYCISTTPDRNTGARDPDSNNSKLVHGSTLPLSPFVHLQHLHNIDPVSSASKREEKISVQRLIWPCFLHFRCSHMRRLCPPDRFGRWWRTQLALGSQPHFWCTECGTTTDGVDTPHKPVWHVLRS